jgi:cytochrome P450
MKYGLTTEQFRSYVPLIVEQVEDYLKKSKYFKGAQGQAPLLEVIPEITIFTASRSLQGKEVRDGLDGRFATLMHHLDVSFNPMNFLFPWIPWPSNRRRDNAQREMARFYMSVIEKRRAQKIDPNQEKTDMIWNLMDRTYKNGRPVTDREVAHMMIALVGSRSTIVYVTQLTLDSLWLASIHRWGLSLGSYSLLLVNQRLCKCCRFPYENHR